MALHGQFVTILKVRNFGYQAEDRFTPAWYDATYDLGKLNSVWFVVEPFGRWSAAAHTRLTHLRRRSLVLGIVLLRPAQQ